MKRVLLALAAILALLLSACTSATDAKKDAATNAGSATTGQKGGTIALFMTHMSNEFTKILSSNVEKEVKARGFEYKVYDAAQDAAKQQSQMEQAANLGVKAMIIEPVSVDGIVPAVKQAKSGGVKVVIVNQRISDPSAANAYVGADAATTGEMLMEQAVKDLGGKGDIALLLGPMGSDGQVGRSKGFQQVLDQNKDVKVIFQGPANWESAPALQLTDNWLNSGKTINAIVAQNDGMAVGAAKAASDAGKAAAMKIYGVDATSEGLQAVVDGKLAATVSQGTEDQGKLSADAAADLVEGKTVKPETIVSNVVYTKANAAEALAKMK